MNGQSSLSTKDKVKRSAAAVLGIAALVGGGTFALFSDSATAEPTIDAGTVDLKIDGLDTDWVPMAFTDVLPTDTGEKTVAVSNAGTAPGTLTATINNLNDAEGDCIVPAESDLESSDDTCTPAGELQDQMDVTVTLGEVAHELTPLSEGTELELDQLAAGADATDLTIAWELPDQEDNNKVQGDELSFDIDLELVQDVQDAIEPGSQSFSATSSDSSGSVQTFTAPHSGEFTLAALGAQGGGQYSNGGRGASMTGTFDLTKGDTIDVLVGQAGSTYSYYGSGGGGTFVTQGSTPLIVAGGGGGNYYSYTSTNADAPTGTSGNSGYYGGGSSGNGGSASGYSGGGGGGMTANGSSGYYAYGGQSRTNGGAGGTYYYYYGANGGFGGGGAAAGYYGYGNGGGGGYSGGGAGYSSTGGGGGGSYNAGTDQVNTAGARTGHGQVTISWE